MSSGKDREVHNDQRQRDNGPTAGGPVLMLTGTITIQASNRQAVATTHQRATKFGVFGVSLADQLPASDERVTPARAFGLVLSGSLL